MLAVEFWALRKKTQYKMATKAKNGDDTITDRIFYWL